MAVHDSEHVKAFSLSHLKHKYVRANPAVYVYIVRQVIDIANSACVLCSQGMTLDASNNQCPSNQNLQQLGTGSCFRKSGDNRSG
jgi:hypothetical protein